MTNPAYEEIRRARSEEASLISAMLKDRVDALAPLLLPEGRREGANWRAGSKGSKSIVLTGPNRGVYRDFEQSSDGMDMLKAIAELLHNGSLREAVAWAKSYLGMADMDAGAIELARRKSEERAAKDRKDKAAQDLKRRSQAGGIWHSAAPLAGTMAETYLRDARGIHLDRLAAPPNALRFSPKVWCKDRRGEYPAMVSSLWRMGDPKLVAVHRTYLDAAPDGSVDKAKTNTPRSILGSWPGAVIPIQRGEAGTRWKDIEEGELVALGEGIEEGLSVALVKPTWRVGAVGFVGNFSKIALPVWCHLMICANNDPPGSEAAIAIDRAVPALEERGHVVRVLRPPNEFKDWNDFLRGVKRGR